MSRPSVLILAALVCLTPLPADGQAIRAPAEHLGFEVGADRTLADWPQIVDYFGTLAAASPAVKLDTLGETTLGRPLLLATISTPENMRNLEAIRSAQARLADPRMLSAAEEERLVATQPVILLIQCNIHSNEVAASQMAMELAHRLATNDTLQAALRNVVVLLIPSANPDGHQMITEWYRRYVGTEWEGGPMPWLYHHYVGHDNNRDWFMVTQRETRLITDLLYRHWFPQVFYDVHQMGNAGMRFFVPPFVDPINPNVDPLIVRKIGHIGAIMSLALEERGKQGVGHSAVYDLWWHGGARSTPTRHNIVGILTEAASVRIATPVEQDSGDLRGHARGLARYEQRMNFPNPWPGGSWRLRDIVDYELIASEALVHMLAVQRERYVRNYAALGRKSVERGRSGSPRAYVIPRQGQHDPAAASRLLEVLRVGGLEMRRTDQAYIVPLAQPYRAHAVDLLEAQEFPSLEQWPGGPPERPYDVAGWTLQMQMGVRVDSSENDLTRVGEPVATLEPMLDPPCPESAGAGPRVLDPRDSDSYRMLTTALTAGARVRIAAAPLTTTAGIVLPRGSFVLEHEGRLARDARVSGCALQRVRSVPAGRTLTRMPRVGIYQPWTANMDEGWTRFVLEQFGFRYTTLHDSVVKRGGLRDQFDVVLVPSMSVRDMREGVPATRMPPPWSGGLGDAGLAQLREFATSGGTLVLLDQATALVTAAPGAAVRAIRVPRASGATAVADTGVDSAVESLYAPGSVFRMLLDPAHPVAGGMPDTAAAYFTNSVTFAVPSGSRARVIARYPAESERILMSGFLQGADAIAGQAAAVEVPLGSGRAILFGFRPQHRGQTYGTFKMLFNALLSPAAS